MAQTDERKYTLIGDIVLSREAHDRAGLQRALTDSLRTVNDELEPLEGLVTTVGDEVQGSFASLAGAVRASLQLRLELLARGDSDSRYGIGYGEVTVFDPESSHTQDGPGWWSAREAIEGVDSSSRQPRWTFLRTRFESDELGGDVSFDPVAWVNAFLIVRDRTVDRMNPRARRLLLGVLKESRQAELAEQEGISQSAVSQSLAAAGAYAVVEAERLVMSAR
jgi:hypothetical protein